MASGLRRLRKVAPQAPPPETHGRLVVLPLREGTQAVAVLSPAGELLREVGVLGAAHGKLCSGGPDSRTVYVKEVTKQRHPPGACPAGCRQRKTGALVTTEEEP
jgi:hypothetical protein